MGFSDQAEALDRHPQELITVGVRECQNWYALLVGQFLTRTEELDHADWIKTSVTVTPDDGSAPDGTQTADLVQFNAASDALTQQVSGESVTSKSFNASVWMKLKSGSGGVRMRIRNVSGSAIAFLTITPTTEWVRYHLQHKFAISDTGDVVFDLFKPGATTLDVWVWGPNLYRHPTNQDVDFRLPYRKRVDEALSPSIDPAAAVSRCSIGDAGDGSRCYYSRHTCQDPDNFNAGNTYEATAPLKGIREDKFCNIGGPLPFDGGEGVMPMLESSPSAVQEIDPERAVTVNERLTLRFRDHLFPGVWNPRQQSLGMPVNTLQAGSTYWRRWRAINRNYSNPECYVTRKVGYVEAGGTESDFQQRGKYLMLNFQTRGEMAELVCGDRLKLARTEIPSQIGEDNKLDGTITDVATTMVITNPLELSPLAPNASEADPDWVVTLELDPDEENGASEKVNVTAVDFDTKQLTVQRGRWGTTARSHVNQTSFREVAEFGTERTGAGLTPIGKNPVDILIEMYRYAGLEADEIDTTTLEDERDTWLPSIIDASTGTQKGISFRRTVTEPTEIESLAQEIRDVTLMFMWVSDSQMLTGKVFAPRRPNETLVDVNDDSNIIAGTVETDDQEETRVSRALLAYDLATDGSPDSLADYEQVRIELDVDAEEREFYGKSQLKSILSQWIQPQDTETAAYVTGHILARFRHGARLIRATLEIRDDDITLGSFIRVNTRYVVDEHGANLNSIMQVVKKKPVRNNRIQIEALDTGLFHDYAFYSPAGTPVWSSASDDEKEAYGFYSDANGRVGSSTKNAKHYW